MRKVVNYSKMDQINHLIGLLIGCPMLKRENCPLAKYDELTIDEKITFAQGMSKQEISEIIGYHRDCLQRRESQEKSGNLPAVDSKKVGA